MLMILLREKERESSKHSTKAAALQLKCIHLKVCFFVAGQLRITEDYLCSDGEKKQSSREREQAQGFLSASLLSSDGP